MVGAKNNSHYTLIRAQDGAVGATLQQSLCSHPSSPATLEPHEMVLVSAATRRAPLLPATERVCQLDRSSTILGYLSCVRGGEGGAH